MSPRLSSHIVLLLVLRITYALDLFGPSSGIFPGENVTLSWTFAPDDPDTFNLDLLCNDASQALASSVSTASMLAAVTVPLSLSNPSSPSPQSCNFRAQTVNNNALLDSVPVTVSVISGSAKTTNSISTMVTTASNSELSFTFTNLPEGTSSKTQTSTSPPQTTSSVDASSDESPTRSTSSSHNTASASNSTQTSTTPIGAIVGGVVGGFVGLGILVIIFFICLRRRRRLSSPPSPPPPPPPPPPIPLPYDQNYVQPLDKNSRLAQIAEEKDAAQWQRDQLQAQVNHNSTYGTRDTPFGSGVLEQMEALRQRILELEAQQRDLEHQLHGEQPLPAQVSNENIDSEAERNESSQNGPSGPNDTVPENGPVEQQLQVLLRGVFELFQRQDLGHQLYHREQPPPSYSAN